MGSPRTNSENLKMLRELLAEYEQAVNKSALRPESKKTRISHAEYLVRWAEGTYEPGERLR